MNFSRTVWIFASVLLLVLATTAQTASAQTAPSRTVMWLHGRGETDQGYWNRFAGDLLNNRGRIDTLYEFQYSKQGGYYSPNDIISTSTDIYYGFSPYPSFKGLKPFIDLTDKAKNPILIGHSQGGIIAREIDRQFPNNLGGMITVGSPNGGVGLLSSRATKDPRTGLNQIEVASKFAITALARGPVYDPLFGMTSIGYLGGQFIALEMCDRDGQNSFWDQFAGVLSGLGYSLASITVNSFVSNLLGIGGALFVRTFIPPSYPIENWLVGIIGGISGNIYSNLEANFLKSDPSNSSVDYSIDQMAPPGVVGDRTTSILPNLDAAPLTTPRAGIYGTAQLQSPIRLFSHNLGRLTSAKLLDLPCRINPGEATFPGFRGDIPEFQTLRQPNDEHLLRYTNRMRDIYKTGKDINRAIGIITFPLQGLLWQWFRMIPTAFDVANAWEDGERFYDSELQNTYSYLIRATRMVSTTQRITINYYSCPSSPGVRFNLPPSDECIYVSEEVDRVFEYTVSAGDDGFIAQQDQQIPLRDASVRDIRFENNFQAGDPNDPNPAFRKSCNHFIEGNHPKVYERLQFMLQTSDSPFFVPQR